MKLQRLGAPGAEIPVVRTTEGVYDLRPITTDIDGVFLSSDAIAHVARELAAGRLPEVPNADLLRVGPPVARPSAVLCIGQNYAAHAAESGADTPTVPILFFKHPNTVVGPNDDVPVPAGALKVDWEVELAVVIGRVASGLSIDDDPLAYVAGYAVTNDVSERAWQIDESGGQWSKGKSARAFNPLGPELVTADDIPDPQRLRLWSRVNGESRQESNTADMIFSVADIVRHLSHYLVLEPGDVINTGTPQGVALSGRFPYLRPGDLVEMGIEGLGEQSTRFV